MEIEAVWVIIYVASDTVVFFWVRAFHEAQYLWVYIYGSLYVYEYINASQMVS